MEKTPYAYDFLWHQVELAYNEIRKPKYRELLKSFLFEKDFREKAGKLKDKKGRNYTGGLLEAVASQSSLLMCIYDNYPEIDIDLLLTGVILKLYCRLYSKKECYQKLKDYQEVIPLLFKKSRKKPSVELTIYDSIEKLDNKIVIKLQQKRRKKDGS
jgi:hypothetical protein